MFSGVFLPRYRQEQSPRRPDLVVSPETLSSGLSSRNAAGWPCVIRRVRRRDRLRLRWDILVVSYSALDGPPLDRWPDQPLLRPPPLRRISLCEIVQERHYDPFRWGHQK